MSRPCSAETARQAAARRDRFTDRADVQRVTGLYGAWFSSPSAAYIATQLSILSYLRLAGLLPPPNFHAAIGVLRNRCRVPSADFDVLAECMFEAVREANVCNGNLPPQAIDIEW